MSRKFLNGADMGSQKITSVADPTSAQDAATKNYITTQMAALIGGGTKVYSNTDVTGNTVANTTTETAFTSTYTIPANSLSAGDVIRLKLWGVYGTFVTPPNITIKVKIGSTVVLNSGAITTIGSITNFQWLLDIDLSFFTIGASGTCDSQAYAVLETAATTGLSSGIPSTSTSTIDTTASQAITVTITWSAANASNTITLRQMNIEALKVQGSGTPVAVAQGGTGDTTLTNHGVLIGAATSPVNVTSAGTAGQVLTSNGASADPTFQAASGGNTPATKAYAVTATNNGPSGGVAEVDILSISVPANDFADGDEIIFSLVTTTTNNSGANTTCTVKFYWGANSVTPSIATMSNSANIGQTVRDWRIRRIGSDIWVNSGPGSSQGDASTIDSYSQLATTFRLGGILTSQSFSSTTTLKFSVTFANSDPNIYVKVKSVRCMKISQA